MTAYLELNELKVGRRYRCEMYSGEIVVLRYDGGTMFEGLSVDGDIRFVFMEVDV